MMDHKNLLEHPENLKFLPVKDIFLLNKNINIDDLTPQLKGIALESFKIESQYKKTKIAFNELKDRLLCESIPWVSEKEINDIETNHFGSEKNIHELQVNLLHVDNFIKKIRLNEVRQMIEHKAELVVDENFVRNYPMAARFIRKMMLDNISFTMFGKVEQTSNELLIEKKESDSDQKTTTFIYFNTKPMEKIKQTKITEIVDSSGKVYTVKDIFQSHEMFETLSQIEKRLIKLKVPIYFGTIVCGDK